MISGRYLFSTPVVLALVRSRKPGAHLEAMLP